MDPTLLAKDFVFKALDKIDFYWHFLTIGLLAFAGWLASGKTRGTRHIKCLLLGGYICFAAMNLYALDRTYVFAESAIQDLANRINVSELPRIHAYAKEKFAFGRQRVAAYCIHGLMLCVFGYAIIRIKDTPPETKE
jgi:hypothetical protein